MHSRRHFLLGFAAGAPALLAIRASAAEEPVKLTEDDPTAKALGYKEDTTKVDQTKYPMHKPEQRCDGCALYTGKAGEDSGPCSAVGNKIVTAGGWCMVFAPKPAAK
jgi:hypothetical protein